MGNRFTNEREARELPPEPPQHQSKIRVYKLQMIGIPLLMALPILALLRVFGPAPTTQHLDDGTLELQVRWPTRIHYKDQDTLEVSVRNLSEAPVGPLELRIHDYLSHFGDLTVYPEVDRITKDAHEIVLEPIPPNTQREVLVQMQAEDFGRFQGHVSVGPPGSDQLTLPIQTFSFP